MTMRRVVVVGAAGAGKSTLARALAEGTGGRPADLDLLFWGPGWSRRPAEEFRADVRRLADEERWVVAGSYLPQVADVLWSRADVLVWLDLPRRVSFTRVVRRTVRQLLGDGEVFPECHQSLRAVWRDGLLGSAWRDPGRHRRDVPELLGRPAYAQVRLVRLRSAGQARNWLRAQVNAAR
ncbi:adenylate kinase [Streptomyces sp. NRRL WC-3742]|uniref:adenylate kinase n=1 Tax=Streptomyces sp. NRRL WC-3742 TaxID=1463934 RepID=UPI00131D918A|nr:adenylate kinase [Streptomyces sp. NRRL WC-3742]